MDARSQAVQSPVLLLSIWRRASALCWGKLCVGRSNPRARDVGVALASSPHSRKQGRAKSADHAETKTRNAYDNRTKIEIEPAFGQSDARNVLVAFSFWVRQVPRLRAHVSRALHRRFGPVRFQSTRLRRR